MADVHHHELVTPPPAQINSARIAIIGTLLWFVAFLVLLPFYGRLHDHGHSDWLWTCLAGWILGLIGTSVTARHRKQGRTA